MTNTCDTELKISDLIVVGLVIIIYPFSNLSLVAESKEIYLYLRVTL